MSKLKNGEFRTGMKMFVTREKIYISYLLMNKNPVKCLRISKLWGFKLWEFKLCELKKVEIPNFNRTKNYYRWNANMANN